jgi:hypothetical protein
MVISGSRRLANPTCPIPAIDRFDGPLAKLLRKHYKQLRNVDVFFVSPTYGIVNAKEEIGFREPLEGFWDNFDMCADDVKQLRERNIQILRRLLSKKHYSEVYLNVGQKLLRLMPNIEELVPESTKIVYAKGAGFGPKMTHMKEWMESQFTRARE